jgi:hypothetical protein
MNTLAGQWMRQGEVVGVRKGMQEGEAKGVGVCREILQSHDLISYRVVQGSVCSQFSCVRPGTRSNSLVLAVTMTAFSVSA